MSNKDLVKNSPYRGQINVPPVAPKKTMWQKMKDKAYSALGEVPTGIGVSTKKKGVIQAKDTGLMEE